MNKGIYSLFALFFVAILTGCASQNSSTASANEPSNHTQINITVNKK
jgi:hypothetical protein